MLKDQVNKLKFTGEKCVFPSGDCTLIHTSKHHFVPADSQHFTMLEIQTTENWHKIMRPTEIPRRTAAMFGPPSFKSDGHSFYCPRLAAISHASVSPLLHCRLCYLSSLLFAEAWLRVIKKPKHFEILGTNLKEDFESVQPWKRKEIPDCPLQLISCQAGVWDLITPSKSACINTNIPSGGSNPTALFTLCFTCCLCWGKENCFYICRLTSCIRLPRYQCWSCHIIRRVMISQETDMKTYSFWAAKAWHSNLQRNVN